MFYYKQAKVNMITYLVIIVFLSLLALIPSEGDNELIIYLLGVYSFICVFNMFLYVQIKKHIKGNRMIPRYMKVVVLISLIIVVFSLIFNLEAAIGFYNEIKDNKKIH